MQTLDVVYQIQQVWNNHRMPNPNSVQCHYNVNKCNRACNITLNNAHQTKHVFKAVWQLKYMTLDDHSVTC